MTFKILEDAARIVKEKKKIDFVLKDCRLEQEPRALYNIAGTSSVALPSNRKMKLSLTVIEDHISWWEYCDLEYIIFEKDLLDESLVDKIIGGDLSKYNLEDRMILRLAFIIYNGIQYGVKQEQRIKDIEAGWHPRVVNISTRF